MHRPVRIASVMVAGMLALSACGSGTDGDDGEDGTSAPQLGPEDEPDDEPAEDEDTSDGGDGGDDADGADGADGSLEVTDVVTGLEAPWDVVATGDDRALVTERDSGRLLEIVDGEASEVRRFEVDPTGEGGLLGLAVGPEQQHLYTYYTSAEDNRVVRLDLDELDAEPEPIVTGIPKASIHNGGRLRFGPEGMLHIGTGDAGDGARAQDPDSLGGKILRVTPDGEIPEDNPDPDSPVLSLGHRNVQGLAFDADGRLWATEFGPDADDEVNLIEPGANYGWPEVTGAPGVEGFVDAAFVRQPDEASWSGAAIPTDPTVEGWEGNLFAAGLRGGQLWQLELDGDEVVGAEALLAGELGRLRTVREAPEGALWVLTSNRDGRGSPDQGDDRLVRYGPS